MKLKKLGCFSIALAIAFSGFQFTGSCSVLADENSKPSNASMVENGTSYQEYIKPYKDARQPKADIFISGASFTNEMNSKITKEDTFEGVKDVVKWSSEEGWVEWEFDIPESGLYNMGLKYYPLEAKGRDIEISTEIDGKVPFEGAKRLNFSRIWKDAESIERDNRGNDLRPEQIEEPAWIEGDFKDSDGLYNEAYKFYFARGKHKIRLSIIREALAIAGLHIYQKEVIQSYAEVSKGYSVKGYKQAGSYLKSYQAETALYKSHSTLYPMYDKSSAATEPSDPAKIRLNTIGQWNWEYHGQWISWKFEVLADGFYTIALKARQNFIRGMYSTRKLYLDGKIPFKEMENVKFPYSISWYTKVLGDKEPYQFYLTKGEHELKLEVTPGDIAETLQVVEKSVFDLNYIYRKIIMITGTTPDTYRDYRLDEKIPGLMDNFRQIREDLSTQLARIEEISDGKGSEASILEEIINQLDSFLKEPDTIPQRLERYKSNVSSLGAWILDMRYQPLELDYFVIKSPDEKAPSAKANFFSQLVFDAKAFIASFTEKYNSVGNIYDAKKAITVWVSSNDIAQTGISTGRDQAQIIKRLIDDTFTPDTGIEVNLSLVDSSQTLVQATLAGKGPDIALFVPKETPVNLAMRGALLDLSKFDEYEQIIRRFMKSATIPFEYEGGHYAMPETQDFYMMFYRKDILSELGAQVPNTWEDFYNLIPVIQKSNMEIGIPPESQQMFQSLLFQKGGQFYAADKKSTDFDKPEALEAFKEWTGFYSKYSFPVQFDFYNRFRTGEMPVGIMPYSMYNLLSVAAPELRNLWDMAPIPGTPKSDGTINRRNGSTGTGSIILKDTKDSEASFKFLEWWTSSEVQANYGIELEALMGPAARYNTANVEAFNKLPWSKAEAENLLNQWQYVWDIPQLPGNYYTSRNITFAFRGVVYKYENERETLNKYNREINKEILRKREEFNLK